MSSKIWNGIAIVIKYIGIKISFLKHKGYSGKIFIERLHHWPPNPFIVKMCSCMINDTRESCSLRIVSESMNNNFVHSFSKSSVTNRFHFKRPLLPMLKGSKSLHFNDAIPIDMRCRRYFLNYSENVYSLIIKAAVVNPKFSSWNIQTCTQCFDGIYRHIVQRKPWTSGFTVIF